MPLMGTFSFSQCEIDIVCIITLLKAMMQNLEQRSNHRYMYFFRWVVGQQSMVIVGGDRPPFNLNPFSKYDIVLVNQL